MAETTTFWSSLLPFAIEDLNYNVRNMSPEFSFEDPLQKKTKTTTQNSWFIKLVTCPHFTDNFFSSSILLTWARDGSSEQTAVRQPIAS